MSSTRNIYMVPTRLTSSAAVHSGACFLGSVLIGTDGVNDPVVAVYNNTSASDATRVVPSVTYDASVLGLNGVVLEFAMYCDTGLYVNITNIGSGEVIVTSRLFVDVPNLALR